MCGCARELCVRVYVFCTVSISIIFGIVVGFPAVLKHGVSGFPTVRFSAGTR